MKVLPRLACGLLILIAVGQTAYGQAALERLEKRLQKRAKPGPRPAAADQPDALPADAADDRPAPRELDFQPGYFGAITDDRFDPDRGVRIVEAVADGPAEQAGLREDDLIVGLNGRPVKNMADLARVLERSPPGAELAVDIERNGEKHRLEVTLAERPAPDKRREPEFGRVPDGRPQPGAADDGDPLQPAPRAPADRPDRLRQLEQRLEKLEQRLEKIEALLRERV